MPVTYDEKLKRAMQDAYLSAIDEGKPWSAARELIRMQTRQEELLAQGFISGLDQLPNEKTLRRWANEADEWPEAEKQQARRAKWPKSFDDGLLPQEYAPAFLSLLSHEGRPSIRRARWHWRVSSAAPEMPEAHQRELSLKFAVRGAIGALDDSDLRSLEYFLACRGWIDVAAYEKRLVEVREQRPDIYKIEGLGEPSAMDAETAIALMVERGKHGK